MTHLQITSKEQIDAILKDLFILTRPVPNEKFLAGDPFIFQSDKGDYEVTLKISGITHSVPGLMKNWIIISFEKPES